jgi:hypothetical protein
MSWSPERQREYMRRYYAENKERLLEQMEAWRTKNKARHLERAREYHRANKDAINERKRAHRVENPEHFRNLLLKRQYGMTVEAFERMRADQGGGCAVCQKDKPLVVDHDHEDGGVRGLLCNQCNQALGLLEDDCGRFYAAIKYLRQKRSQAA